VVLIQTLEVFFYGLDRDAGTYHNFFAPNNNKTIKKIMSISGIPKDMMFTPNCESHYLRDKLAYRDDLRFFSSLDII